MSVSRGGAVSRGQGSEVRGQEEGSLSTEKLRTQNSPLISFAVSDTGIPSIPPRFRVNVHTINVVG